MAARFLHLLDATAPGWTFQTFDDTKAKRPHLARVLHGSLAGHAAALADLQQAGAGIFVTVNETDLRGRSRANVTRVRAFFVDLDGAPLEPVRKWLEPHILAETSPGKWHAYWLVRDCPLDAFTGVQKRLIAAFGSDGAVHDLPRVMRLPGFWHLKANPVQVKLWDTALQTALTLADFEERLAAREAELALVVPAVAALPLTATALPVGVELDHPMNVTAVAALLCAAEPAVEKAGGYLATVELIQLTGDYGLSEETAVDLLMEHWAHRCVPPWEREQLAEKLRSLWTSRQNPVGCRSVAMTGEPLDQIPGVQAAVPRYTPTPFMWAEPSTLPQRRWVYGKHYIRDFISCTVSPGGLGKTTHATAEGLSVVTGFPLLGERPVERCNVWMANLEDPRDEMQRRVQAAMMHYGVDWSEVRGRLFIDGADTMQFKVARVSRGVVTPDAEAIRQVTGHLIRERIGVWQIDPFIRSHGVSENDNDAIDEVAAIYRGIARNANASIELLHHTKKTGGAETTVEDARGATALIGAVRSARVLNVMSETEASSLGVAADRRRLHVRVDDGKANMSPPGSAAHWVRLTGVSLGNGTPERPEPDHVATVEPWTPPPLAATVTDDMREKILAVLRKGPDGGCGPWRASDKAAGYAGLAVMDVLGLDHESKLDRRTVRRQIDQLVEQGYLSERIEKRNGKPVPLIYVPGGTE